MAPRQGHLGFFLKPNFCFLASIAAYGSVSPSSHISPANVLLSVPARQQSAYSKSNKNPKQTNQKHTRNKNKNTKPAPKASQLLPGGGLGKPSLQADGTRPPQTRVPRPPPCGAAAGARRPPGVRSGADPPPRHLPPRRPRPGGEPGLLFIYFFFF